MHLGSGQRSIECWLVQMAFSGFKTSGRGWMPPTDGRRLTRQGGSLVALTCLRPTRVRSARSWVSEGMRCLSVSLTATGRSTLWYSLLNEESYGKQRVTSTSDACASPASSRRTLACCGRHDEGGRDSLRSHRRQKCSSVGPWTVVNGELPEASMPERWPNVPRSLADRVNKRCARPGRSSNSLTRPGRARQTFE